KGQTSRGVSALVVGRLVLREYRREGRGVCITLTKRGTQLYDELMISALARNDILLHGMSDAERRELFEILDRLTSLARSILEREQRTYFALAVGRRRARNGPAHFSWRNVGAQRWAASRRAVRPGN